MRILLLGYGKMGQLIGQLAEERGHELVGKITIDNVDDLDQIHSDLVDVAIEFSQPEAAVSNIKWALEKGIPILSGTTGWLANKPELDRLTLEKNGAFFYASNYSIGVNIFFKVNQYLAKLMNDVSGYQVSIEEIHHTEKKDAPSGTALTLAEGIIGAHSSFSDWNPADQGTSLKNSLPIHSKRIDPAPGTHIINYSSSIDSIEIKHTAHSRAGFALGAILVAEWLQSKKGVLSMDDFLSF